jgi:hypothetical protein
LLTLSTGIISVDAGPGEHGMPERRLVAAMTREVQGRARSATVDTDLVEYIVVAVPDLASLSQVATAVRLLTESGVIRILDLVVIARSADDGLITVMEFDEVDSLAALRDVDGEAGGLLSAHDIDLAAAALAPESAGILLLAEDSWAEPLSQAAQHAGGRVIAGERIPRSRIEAALRKLAIDARRAEIGKVLRHAPGQDLP